MTWLDSIQWDRDGLVPVIAQEAGSGDVLMFAFMNAEALAHTIQSGKATYWSRSRNKLWIKGEESGNAQLVKALLVDCDQDVILLKVENVGGASCHNGYKSCFYRRLAPGADAADGGTLKLEFAAPRIFDPATVYKKK